jgi:hypothetical protein
MSDEHNSVTTNPCDSGDVATIGRLLQHIQNPQHLLTYMVATAWVKFMDLTQYIPTITIGG